MIRSSDGDTDFFHIVARVLQRDILTPYNNQPRLSIKLREI